MFNFNKFLPKQEVFEGNRSQSFTDFENLLKTLGAKTRTSEERRATYSLNVDITQAQWFKDLERDTGLEVESEEVDDGKYVVTVTLKELEDA